LNPTPNIQGRDYWLSLEQLAGTSDVAARIADEFQGYDPEAITAMSRRKFLRLMGASMALAGLTLSGCRRYPEEKIAPHSRQPDNRPPGTTVQYATCYEIGGVATGVLATSYDGRPIKIEGNPLHPGSLGATDATAQASVLDLYDPNRSRSVSVQGKGTTERALSTWEAFTQFAQARIGELAAVKGAGLVVLCEATSSLMVDSAHSKLQAALPEAKWFEYEAISRDNAIDGGRQVMNQAVRPLYDLSKAKVIASFDADLFGSHPAKLRLMRDWAAGRRSADEGAMNRLYIAESRFSQTGSVADERIALRPTRVETLLTALAAKLRTTTGAAASAAPLDDRETRFIDLLAADLKQHGRDVLVVAGDSLPPAAHAAVHLINTLLGATGHTVTYIPEPRGDRPTHLAAIASVTQLLNAGKVNTLLILGGNPAYDAPAEFDFAAAIGKAASIHLSHYLNETSQLCSYHLPRAHYLEAWGDGRAWDGTVSIAQPLIMPLYGGKSIAEVVDFIASRRWSDSYELIRAAMQRVMPSEHFEKAWRRALHDGVVKGSALQAIEARSARAIKWEGEAPAEPFDREARPRVERSNLARWTNIDASGSAGGTDKRSLRNLSVEVVSELTTDKAPSSLVSATRNGSAGASPSHQSVATTTHSSASTAAKEQSSAFDLVFFPDPFLHDGRFAPNGWLQEAPDPMTKVTWDNAALISKRDADALSIRTGDVITIEIPGRKLDIAAYIMPGQPSGVIALPLGYGRTAAGPVGTGVGFNTFTLRTAAAPFVATGAAVTKAGARYTLALTQDHHIIDDIGMRGREQRVGEKGKSGTIIKDAALAEYKKDKHFVHRDAHGNIALQLFAPPHQFNEPHAWGMAVDMSSCTGCNACLVACQAENNVPIVGKDEVERSREMHWLRIDRYFKGDAEDENPQVIHQPMMCVHCENAPCEQVCPVAATVHDTEGLNTMVYNRCIGTRYCSNNCPYKVRRFNYFDFHSKDPREGATPWLGMPDTQQREQVDKIKRMVFNPEVTVRMRGVMEKCTYCTQRIQAAKITRRNAGEEIKDGDVVTACQSVCPTQAIVFGNLNDKNSKVRKLHENNRSYSVLGELNTRPRTKYLAKVRNPAEKPS